MSFLQSFYDIFTESAPYLILGFFIAGLMKALIPQQWMQRQLGGKSLWHVVKAAIIGAPLPLCSCGVLPAAMGLRRSGASKKSTVSFLVATPETGADSISLSWVLLGPFMAIVRPFAAIASAITAGLLVKEDDTPADNQSKAASSCCAKKTGCGATAENSGSASEKVNIIQGLDYAFTQLLNDITFWLFLGLGVAALMQAYVPTNWFADFGDSFWLLILMAVIGIPMYICASASTPIAAGLLATGISPGAILVFMLAGPATNIGSIAIIRKELGNAAVIGYLSGVIGMALLCGVAVNWIVTHYDVMPAIKVLQQHQHDATLVEKIMSIILLLLTARALLIKNATIKKIISKFKLSHASGDHSTH